MGERYVVRCDRIAHGGHVVGRHEGVVVFIRHALPGELVEAEVTEGAEGDRFLRADAVTVLEASDARVEPPCPYAGPGRCGGCDFQHVALPTQRALKAAVVREQLSRLAGLDVPVEVAPVPGDTAGLGWRTRVQFSIAVDGRAGLRKHRSHDVLPIDHCPIAHTSLPEVTTAAWPEANTVEAIVSAAGERLRIVTSGSTTSYDGPQVLHERSAGRSFQVTGSGFWQVHPGAADALTTAVLAALEPRPGESVADLYAGVGLFSAALAEGVGAHGSVRAVESDATAVEDAISNLRDLPQVRVLRDRVDRALRRGALGAGLDLVVLDPPRVGARKAVVAAVAALGPRAVAYVACDPAALSRDVATFGTLGYRLSSVRGFDIFPMTHHVECVALLEPAG